MISINEPCHVCGTSIDLTLRENRGLLIVMRARLNGQIVSLVEIISKCKDAQKLQLNLQLETVQKELKSLPHVIHGTL